MFCFGGRGGGGAGGGGAARCARGAGGILHLQLLSVKLIQTCPSDALHSRLRSRSSPFVDPAAPLWRLASAPVPRAPRAAAGTYGRARGVAMGRSAVSLRAEARGDGGNEWVYKRCSITKALKPRPCAEGLAGSRIRPPTAWKQANTAPPCHIHSRPTRGCCCSVQETRPRLCRRMAAGGQQPPEAAGGPAGAEGAPEWHGGPYGEPWTHWSTWFDCNASEGLGMRLK